MGKTEKKSSAKTEKKGIEVPYSTQNGTFGIDGQQITRCNQTYNRMYRTNSDIQRCVEEIQQTSGKSGFEVRKQMRTREIVKETPIFSNALENSGGFRFLKAEMLKSLLIFGNIYIRIGRNLSGKPILFEILDARYVSVVTDENFKPLRYLYRNPKKIGVYEYSADDILHEKNMKDWDNPVF